MVSEEKNIEQILSSTKRMKNTPILLLLVQQNVGVLIVSITSCPSVVILETTLN
jgi:hypothetical protein